MGLKLFDDNAGPVEEDLSKIEINEEFARRFEHNKKREDLQKLEEMKKKGLVQDSSDSDSDESSSDELDPGELLNSKKDLEFFNALIKVKKQDPELKMKEARLFESEDDEESEEDEEETKKKEKKKPMYLKDVTARHLIEEGPEFEDGEEEKKRKVKSYSEEQEELREEFLKAVEEVGEDDGELLKERECGNVDIEDDEESGEVQKKLDEYFGKDDNLDENEIFLKEFFRKRMWVDEGKSGKGLDEDLMDFSEDEEEIEKQEDYEREFNFRFEEDTGDRVLGHSRVVDGSVRKKNNARKTQRKSKEERMAQAEFERKEELKHLKNLKKKEMMEMLRKVRETAGIGEDGLCPLDVDDLEDEFDPEEYDRKMKEAFNEEYYEAEDANPEFGSDSDEDGINLEKPDFNKEDELLGLPKDWDGEASSGDGFLHARARYLKRKAKNGYQSEDLEEQAEAVPEVDKRKKKQKMSKKEEEVLSKELEEYYKLDYEDTVGDLKTRFKYKEVGARKFGLGTKEILMLDDKELNQYVSLKKIAPYREKEWKVPKDRRYSQKQKIKSLFQRGLPEDKKTGKKNIRDDDQEPIDGATPGENENAEAKELNGETSKLSRKSRRRHRQAELKLPLQRLMAYGKIPAKSKSTKKH